MKIFRLKRINCVALNPKRAVAPGFTLIELLVVIAIIAILASMLLPVLARTKLKATQATCLSNQKQLMLAFMMYCTENNDKIIGFGTMDGYINQGAYPPGVTWNVTGQTSDQSLANLTTALAYPTVDLLY